MVKIQVQQKTKDPYGDIVDETLRMAHPLIPKLLTPTPLAQKNGPFGPFFYAFV